MCSTKASRAGKQRGDRGDGCTWVGRVKVMAVPRSVRGWGCGGRTKKWGIALRRVGARAHRVGDTQLGWGRGQGGGGGCVAALGSERGGRNERKPAGRARVGGNAMQRYVWVRAPHALLYRWAGVGASHQKRGARWAVKSGMEVAHRGRNGALGAQGGKRRWGQRGGACRAASA